MSLTQFYELMISDEENMRKEAADEEAAGRIMARGFLDELTKLAEADLPPISAPKRVGPEPEPKKRRRAPPAVEGTAKQKPWKDPFEPPPPAKKVPTPTHRETGPYGLKSGTKPPAIGPGLLAFGGRTPRLKASPGELRSKMEAAKPPKRKATIGERIKALQAKGERARQSVEGAGRSYGRTFARFGKGLKKSFTGE